MDGDHVPRVSRNVCSKRSPDQISLDRPIRKFFFFFLIRSMDSESGRGRLEKTCPSKSISKKSHKIFISPDIQ